MSADPAPDPPGADADDRAFLARHRAHLSRTTLRARWTHRPGDPADRPGQTLATRTHAVIRTWADARGAIPAAASRDPGGEPRTLRLDFGTGARARADDAPAGGSEGRAADAGRGPGTPDAARGRRRLEPVSWEDWLAVFDRRRLVFLYQEVRRDGSPSNFFRLDSPEREGG